MGDGAVRHDTMRYGATEDRAAQDQKDIDYYYYCVHYLFPSSHESIHKSCRGGSKHSSFKVAACLGAAAASRSATGPGSPGWQACQEPLLAGGRALQGCSDVQGPKRASRRARLFPAHLHPSHPVSTCCTLLSSSGRVQSCPLLPCAVLAAQDESMKRDECSWMETDGHGPRDVPPLPPPSLPAM